MSGNPNDLSVDPHLFQLVISLEAAAMQQMGKLQNPLTEKIDRDIELAKATIDMLSMVERKTEGNLTPDEDKILKRTLYQLRMNYVDELKSEQESESSDAESGNAKQTDETDSETPDESEEDSSDI